MTGNGSDRGRGINRRQALTALGTAVAGTGLATGVASASDLRQVNFCGCSEVCFTGGDPSDYYVWIGYRDCGAWAYNRVIARLENGEGGQCYTVSEGESALGLDDDAEAKIIGISDFDSPRRYVGNPTACAEKPLQTFVEDPPPYFNGFINNTSANGLSLEYGRFRNTKIVRGRCDPTTDQNPVGGNSGNSGNSNSGNSGNGNSGNSNSGNSGNGNSGNSNSGTGNFHNHNNGKNPKP